MTMKFDTINVTSGYGGNTRQPFIEIHTKKLKPDEKIQLSPEEARDLAHNLLQAAEASEQDAFMFEFHSNFVNGTQKEKEMAGATMLFEFRKWRDDHGQNR